MIFSWSQGTALKVLFPYPTTFSSRFCSYLYFFAFTRMKNSKTITSLLKKKKYLHNSQEYQCEEYQTHPQSVVHVADLLVIWSWIMQRILYLDAWCLGTALKDYLWITERSNNTYVNKIISILKCWGWCEANYVLRDKPFLCVQTYWICGDPRTFNSISSTNDVGKKKRRRNIVLVIRTRNQGENPNSGKLSARYLSDIWVVIMYFKDLLCMLK